MMKFEYISGATPIDPDETIGLIPLHISTQDQLNEWEQANIIDADTWAFSCKRKDILNTNFCLKLHKKMFDKTWKWAGQLRRTNKNIGVFWEQIAVKLLNLWDDVKYQIEHDVYCIDEIAARFHHRLVFIHSFANGNGRHARLMTDILLFNNEKRRFSWGGCNLTADGNSRTTYIQALRKADEGNYNRLFAFVRS